MSSGNTKLTKTESCSPGAHRVTGGRDVDTGGCQVSLRYWNRDKSREL